MSRITRRTAFTLIEVLIGVMVLALGLLGLGAIIPVVVREQRDAMTAQLGLEAAKAARSYLQGRPDLDPTKPMKSIGTPSVLVPSIGWDVWLTDRQNWSPQLPAGQTTYQDCYLWWRWRLTGNQQEIGLTLGNLPAWADVPGDFGWHRSGLGPTQFHATIGLADRLWPSESAQGAEILRFGLESDKPLFVWDFIARRVQVRQDPVTGNPIEPEKLQVAIFVRRLDQNIRVPREPHTGLTPPQPVTLRDVVLNRTNNVNGPDYCVPVCSYPQSGALPYMPTYTGTIPNTGPSYSEIISLGDQNSGVTLWFDPAVNSSWLELQGLVTSPGENRWKLVSQRGQKLIDNLGNVYTVRGTLEEMDAAGYQAYQGRPFIVVDPPIPAFVPDPNGSTFQANGPGTLRQIIFTPQVPAAVDVFTITRSVTP